MASDESERLLREIRAARSALPIAHQELLDELRVQEITVTEWPVGAVDLYATLREPTPSEAELDGAAAAWLHELRTVVFNAHLLLQAVGGLDDASRRTVISSIAWHEYGHALSVTRAGPERRDHGLHLLTLLPAGMREAIDYPGRYRASQVFDEIMATLYSMLIGRVPANGYIRPEFLHPDVFATFEEVFPWPPTT
jgi:hypothetical protein